MELKIYTSINPTENKKKIVESMEKTFPGCTFTISKDKIECVTNEQNVLDKLKEKIDEKRIRHTVHYLILKNHTTTGTKIELNKQTLILDKINFVEEHYPLGNVVIETNSVEELDKYLVG